MNIGEKIKRIRQHRRMTQKELGELVDLSANRIAQYEMGYRVPKKAPAKSNSRGFACFPRWHFPMAETARRMIFWNSFSGWTRSSPASFGWFPTERGTARYNANPNLALHYDDNDNWPPRSPGSHVV